MNVASGLALYILVLIVLISVIVGALSFVLDKNTKSAVKPKVARPSVLKVVTLGVVGSAIIFGLMIVYSGQILIFFLFPIWIAILVAWRLR